MGIFTSLKYAGTPVFNAQRVRSAEFMSGATALGPKGVDFFNDISVEIAIASSSTTAYMFDGVTVSDLPSGAGFYAGYYNGTYANLNAIRARFPNDTIVSVTPNGAHGAMYIDVEPGDAVNDMIAAFIKAGGVGFYTFAANLSAAIDACTAAGLSRNDYKVWSAHWTGLHICGPDTCGYPQADGTQYDSTAGWDESAITLPGFLGGSAPAPSPAFPIKAGAKDSTVTGGPVWTVQRGLNKWAPQIKLSKQLTTDGSFGPSTESAVKLALQYWDYSAAAVASGEVDQSLWNHLWSAPPVTSWAYEAPQNLTARGGKTSVLLSWKAPAGSIPANGVGYRAPTAYRINMYTKTGELLWERTTTKTSVQEGSLPKTTSMFARVWAVGAPEFSSGNYSEVSFFTS